MKKKSLAAAAPDLLRLLKDAVSQLISFEQEYRAEPGYPYPEQDNETIKEAWELIDSLEKEES